MKENRYCAYSLALHVVWSKGEDFHIGRRKVTHWDDASDEIEMFIPTGQGVENAR